MISLNYKVQLSLCLFTPFIHLFSFSILPNSIVNMIEFKLAICLLFDKAADHLRFCWSTGKTKAKQSTTTFHLPCNNCEGIATICGLDLF